MRKFSEDVVAAEERQFEVLGQEFRWQYPAWHEFADGLDADTMAVSQRTNGAGEEEKPNEHMMREMYQDYVDRIGQFIDPDWNDGLTRWKALANPTPKTKKSPVPAYLLMEIWNWLLEVTTRSPTKQPSASADGPKETASTSKAGSS